LGNREVMKSWLAIGIGCRRGCSGDSIAVLVRHALTLVSHSSSGHDEDSKGAYDPFGVSLSVGSRQATDPCGRLPILEGRQIEATLFTSERKRDERGMAAAATALRLPLVFLSQSALAAAAARCKTRSARVEAMFGLPSLAEAAAIAGAGPGSRLVLERISGWSATCAIASSPKEEP
jgi:cobalt-precorrin 5A hydrolase